MAILFLILQHHRIYIDHVQITVSEKLGVGHRAGYFDQAGLVRDMLQNHMLQLLSLVAMEAPAKFNAELIRDEKVKVMRAIRSFTGVSSPSTIIRGQYKEGEVNGKKIKSYRTEQGVFLKYRQKSRELSNYDNKKVKLYFYKAGTAGPEEGNALLEKDNRKWILT